MTNASIVARHMGLYVRWEELYGTKPAWQDVTDRLGHYGLANVFKVFGGISSALQRETITPMQELQYHLIHLLFDDPRALLQALDQWTPDSPDLTGEDVFPVLFHEIQLVTAAKIAALTLPETTDDPIESLQPLGEALIMVNDLISAEIEDPLPEDLSKPEHLEAWIRFLVPNQLFNASDSLVHSLARSHELYLRDRTHLSAHAAYVDLPSMFREIAQLEPMLAWTFLFGITGVWRNVDPETGPLPEPPALGTYLTENFAFTDLESRRLFDVLSMSAAAARHDLQSREIGASRVLPYDSRPLADKPLIVIDDRAYCPSVRLLHRKITRGLHYIYMNGLPDIGVRDRYLTYMGVVFEDYVNALFQRMFPASQLVQRYLGPADLEDELDKDQAVCDGVLIYPDTIVLIETKATLLPLAVWADGDIGVLKKKVDAVCDRAAKQCVATARMIEAGHLEHRGIRAEEVRRYLPLLITLEEFPVNPVVYEVIGKGEGSQAIIEENKVEPLQIVDVADLEMLESYVAAGNSVADVLKERIEGESYRQYPLHLFLEQAGGEDWSRQNEYLRGRFRELRAAATSAAAARRA